MARAARTAMSVRTFSRAMTRLASRRTKCARTSTTRKAISPSRTLMPVVTSQPGTAGSGSAITAQKFVGEITAQGGRLLGLPLGALLTGLGSLQRRLLGFGSRLSLFLCRAHAPGGELDHQFL